MKINNKINFIIFSTIVISFNSYGYSKREVVKDLYLNYRKGNYLKVIDTAGILNNFQTTQGLAAYWKGLCYNKLGQYDLAVNNFEQAIKVKSLDAKDLHYEYGQALYAIGEIDKSMIQFHLSAKAGVKKAASVYYLGIISELLDKKNQAIKYYQKIKLIKGADKDFLQAADYKIALMYKEKIKIEKQDRKYLKPKLLPLLYRAEGWSPKTAMANEIRSEIKSIKFLDNHRNKRVWTLRLTDSIGHDSNVVYAPESAADESQNIGATQNKLVIKTGYNYLNQFLNGGILIYPELSFYRKYHFDRKTENIYQYDEMTLTPKVNIKYLSKVWGKYNAMILNLDYVYRQRDYNSDTNLEFYNNTLGVELGNDISLLKTGRTKVSFKYSSISSYLNDLNYTSVRWGMTQDLKLGSYKSMMVSAFMDRASYEDSRYDYNSYLLRLDLFLPNSYYDLGFIASISSNFIDTLSQSDSRGTEKVYTPSVKVIKSYTKNIKISAEYNYIYKISDSESYNYSKHVLMANIEYFN